MSLKYDMKDGGIRVNKVGDEEGHVQFSIVDDTAVAKMAIPLTEEITWVPPAWPANKAELKTQAEDAIKARYPGATPV